MAKTKEQKRLEARDRMATQLLAAHHRVHNPKPHANPRTVIRERGEYETLQSRLRELNTLCGEPEFTIDRTNVFTIGQRGFTFK